MSAKESEAQETITVLEKCENCEKLETRLRELSNEEFLNSQPTCVSDCYDLPEGCHSPLCYEYIGESYGGEYG